MSLHKLTAPPTRLELEKRIETIETKIIGCLNAIAEAKEDIRKTFAAINELRSSMEALGAKLESKKLSNKLRGVTIKAMCMALGKVGDESIAGMCRFYATKYCTTHNLEIRTGEGNRKYDYFPPEAAKYAIETIKGQM